MNNPFCSYHQIEQHNVLLANPEERYGDYGEVDVQSGSKGATPFLSPKPLFVLSSHLTSVCHFDNEGASQDHRMRES